MRDCKSTILLQIIIIIIIIMIIIISISISIIVIIEMPMIIVLSSSMLCKVQNVFSLYKCIKIWKKNTMEKYLNKFYHYPCS